MNRLVCAVLLMAAPVMGLASETTDPGPRRAGLLMNLDLDYGGDNLATVSFTDGESQHIKAGQGVSLGVGAWFLPVVNLPLELQAAIGYKYTTTAATNADIKVTRTTLQLGAVYRFENDWYLGGGLMRHMSPELDGDGFFEDIQFDDATGFSAEVGWKWIGLHYTKLDYSADGYEDADAGYFGLRLTWRPGS